MLRPAMLTASLFLAAATAFASSPGEDSGPAPQPQAGTGAGAALATGMTVADAGVRSLPVTYEVFEATVPHVDLPECPAVMARDGHFCRLGLASEQLTVFVFAEDGHQPLTGLRSWPADVVLSQLK